MQLIDLSGREVDPLQQTSDVARVFLFVRMDCPISNRYAPEIRRLYEKFSPQGIRFFLVYPDPDQTENEIRRHLKEYDFPGNALRDPKHHLVARADATITPQAAVFLQSGKIVYSGRIDDWYVEFGKARAGPSHRDLELALEAILAGKPVPPPTGDPVGCFISDLQPKNHQ